MGNDLSTTLTDIALEAYDPDLGCPSPAANIEPPYEHQERNCGPFSPGSPAIFKEASNVTITNATFNVAGGNITNNFEPSNDSYRPQEVLDQLPVSNFRSFQMDNYAKRTDGTGTWFLDSDMYHEWKASDGGIIWGMGMPGAGKTILASIVIDDLQKEANNSPDTSTAFAYCRYTEPMSVTDVLLGLVRQQLERKPNLASIVGPLFSRHKRENTRPSQQELVDVLVTIAKQFKKNFYNIDGLDESKDDIQFDLITTLASVKVNFFITSRPLDHLKRVLPDATFFTIKANDQDLEKFVAQIIDRTPRFFKLLEREGIRECVIAQIRENSRGMFLHAVLQIETLRHSLNRAQLDEQLGKIPKEIGELYSKSLTRIEDQHPEHVGIAKHLLLWVLYADRPLRIEELQYALAFCPEAQTFDAGRIITEPDLLSLCCGLVTVDHESNQVRLVHYTAKDVLQRLLKPDFPHPHELLATTCIARLVSCHFQNSPLKRNSELREAFRGNALLEYSYEAWGPHLRRCDGESTVWNLASRFIWGCHAFPRKVRHRPFLEGSEGTSLIAQHDLHEVLDLIPPQTGHTIQAWLGLRVNTQSIHRRETALMIASQLDHGSSVQRLLGILGIQVDLVDKNGQTALMLAAARGNEATVRQLLKIPGILVNLVDKNEQTALMLATTHGDEGTVRQLLQAPGIEVNLVDKNEQTALMLAAGWGKEGAARQLLEVPRIEVNLVDKNRQTALMMAAAQGSEHTVRQLLKISGIEVNLIDENEQTALIYAAEWGNEGVVRQLLTVHGIKVDVVDRYGHTALIQAAKEGHEGTVQLLLTAPGIRLDIADGEGKTALMLASERGYERIVQLLCKLTGVSSISMGDS